MSLSRFSLPALALGVALAGCSGARPDVPEVAADGTPVVAVWSADTLSLAAFDTVYTATDGAIADTTQTPLERRLDFLERYVDFRLKVLTARAAGYAEDSSYIAEVEAYRDQLAGPYFTDRQVLDGIVRDIYDKQAEEVEVSHILFLLSPAERDTAAVFARATALRDSIEAGQISFEAAARAYSEDPSASGPAGQNGAGGRLGYLTGGSTILPFEKATYATPVGEIGGPVRTRFGVHLLQVTDRRPRRGDIEARHILIRAAADGSLDSARTAIEGLKARVEAGEDFAELAREFSADTGSGARGGDLGAFGRGRMVPPFEQAAFQLGAVGDLSEPVETRFGVHLIQLTGVSERPTYDEAYDDLRRQAERLPRTALRRQAIGRAFFEERGGTFDEALVREAIGQFPADSVRQQLLTAGFPEGYADQTFATLEDSTYVLSDLVDVYRRTRFGPHPAGEMIEAARQFVDEQAVARAVASLEERDPEFARVYRSYADGVLLFRIAEDSVWTAAKDDTLGLRAYYDARPGDFRWPERRRVLAFRSANDSLLSVVAERLDAGTAPLDVLTDSLDVRLDTVFVADSTQTPLDAVLGLDVGERSRVVTERRGRALYVLDGIEAPRDKTFDEARAELISGYQEELEDAWEARLRARCDARTFPERVPAVSSVPPEADDDETAASAPGR
ncbi:MAG: peptidylprolyl isomerase [Bacteroidota bacterium]